MTDLPDPDIKPARRSLIERISVVWLVPIGALLISLAIAWQNYASRGPLIEIAFEDAEGIRSGETEVRYRDVPVGVVEDVSFAEGLGSVVVSVRLDQEIAPYVDAESEFWVVRPQVTAQGVSGLSTVLSGAYIQGSWDTEPGGVGERFNGLASAPVARPDVPGLRVVLSSETGDGLLQGTPILYRGVQVGAVSTLQLAASGQAVLADAFIEAPYDDLVTSATRFWNASGFSFSLGPQGATLEVSSLAALVSGGVSLENLVSGGDPVDPGTTFELYDSKQEALNSVFADPDTGNLVTVGFVFSGNVSGLTVGSSVEFRGRVGEIVAVTGYIDEEAEDRRVQLLATAELDPAPLGLRAWIDRGGDAGFPRPAGAERRQGDGGAGVDPDRRAQGRPVRGRGRPGGGARPRCRAGADLSQRPGRSFRLRRQRRGAGRAGQRRARPGAGLAAERDRARRLRRNPADPRGRLGDPERRTRIRGRHPRPLGRLPRGGRRRRADCGLGPSRADAGDVERAPGLGGASGDRAANADRSPRRCRRGRRGDRGDRGQPAAGGCRNVGSGHGAGGGGVPVQRGYPAGSAGRRPRSCRSFRRRSRTSARQASSPPRRRRLHLPATRPRRWLPRPTRFRRSWSSFARRRRMSRRWPRPRRSCR